MGAKLEECKVELFQQRGLQKGVLGHPDEVGEDVLAAVVGLLVGLAYGTADLGLKLFVVYLSFNVLAAVGGGGDQCQPYYPSK
jgi:hypothetical protein